MSAPDVFDQAEEDGRVVLIAEELAPQHFEDARRAVELCPSGALSVHDEGAT